MRRIYEALVLEHLNKNQVLFLVGPEEVGKEYLGIGDWHIFSWDNLEDRLKITQGPEAVLAGIKPTDKPRILFHQIHKYALWKTFLNEFLKKKVQVIVTSDSMQDNGEFSYRIHPLSVRELLDPTIHLTKISPPKKIDETLFSNLLTFGGFPEPYMNQNARFHNKWKKSYFDQLFAESPVGMQELAELIKHQKGSLNYSDLAKKIHTSVDTIRRWMEILKSRFYCYTLQPWSTNIPRSLLKEPIVYLWDWSLTSDIKARKRNFIASHLLKTIHFWIDRGMGNYELAYLKDKEKRKVDFLIIKDSKPWWLVQVKEGEYPSKDLIYFQEQLKAEFVFQVSFEKEYENKNCFESPKPLIVSAKTFLSQLS